jgi:hypothetical protein
MYAHPSKSVIQFTYLATTTMKIKDNEDADQDTSSSWIDVMQGLKTGNWNNGMQPGTSQDDDDGNSHLVSFLSHR